MPKMSHIPVLLTEVIEMIRPIQPLRLGLDATFGRGGHSRALLETFAELRLTGLDRDESAIKFGVENFKQWIESQRLKLIQSSFHSPLPEAEGGLKWNLILVDLGVSSPQLDEAARGFSFYNEGPLDMRMDQSQGEMAADIVNQWAAADLIRLFQEYGEIRRPGRVVERIIETRRRQPFRSTLDLAHLIEKAEGWGRRGHHPATRYFLALRLEVNQELAELPAAVTRMMRALAPGGRLLIITFHSLEDRIIKYAFKESGHLGFAVNKKVIVPSREEERRNPRSRSAKLRVFQRIEEGE